MQHLLMLLRCGALCSLFSLVGFAVADGNRVVAVGHMQVEMLIDDTMEGDTTILQGATPEILQQYIPTGKYLLAVTSALVRDGDQIMLIDTGMGVKLVQNLQEKNVDPQNVNTILITHMHFDHINGLMQDGKAVFPNATLYIPEPEIAYWSNDDNIKQYPEEFQPMMTDAFKNSQTILATYQNQIRAFVPGAITEDGKALLPGIKAISAYGHTPGHTVFLLHDQNDKLLVQGDLWHVGTVQFPYPDITVTFDVDQQQATQSRQALFAYAADNAILMTGMHQSNPEFGLIKSHPQLDKGYIFEPLP